MIISLDGKEAFDKIQHFFMVEVLEILWIQETYQNTIKSTYSKSIIKWRKFKAVSLKSGTKHSCSLSSYIFNTVLEALAGAIRKLKEIKGTQCGKDDTRVLTFANDMIIYISDPKNSTRECLQLINTQQSDL